MAVQRYESPGALRRGRRVDSGRQAGTPVAAASLAPGGPAAALTGGAGARQPDRPPYGHE
ncbi:exported protein of unknown function [Streptomyces ambofaciens ATCC 23877]|uniref:Uncharacterized protein n=1 Tax=Streptomyces ambofaciens (strain ATCC 23877 / 3486 / DSM 40053 / JCM 4204 / NBRC 12836 / NRRL B-2516) TaxID=278992 RepID=A0A0K2AK13_STRA7|nr:exported protein of unknown function [Streptomyces ambofaciens ATCC 23877]